MSIGVYASADTFVQKPTGPSRFEELIGKSISFEINEDDAPGFYWETPDTIWIKKVKHPKEGKHYRLTKNPYRGTMIKNSSKYSPFPVDSFLFRDYESETSLTPSMELSSRRFKVLSITREKEGSESLVYSNDYQISIVRLHLQEEESGDLLYWELFNSESKSFNTRTNFFAVKIVLQDIADYAYQSLTLRDYYTGPDSDIELYRPCHISGARYALDINMGSNYRPELEGALYFIGLFDDGTPFEFNSDYPRNLITESEYFARMESRMQRLANQGHYIAQLSKVKKPSNSKIRNGIVTEEKADAKSIYEDNYLTFILGVMEKDVIVFIQNKTDYTMKLMWDEAAFITPSNKTQRVIHSGVTLKDKLLPQAPSIIPGHTILNDNIVPADNISFSSYSGEWIAEPLISGRAINGKYPAGSSFSLLLPIQISGVTNEYLFTFNLIWEYDYPSIREEYLSTHAD